jgi:putative chitobiose transport system substrate-binding protein|nr:extracellular solute-binding protein [Synechococcus sp. CBW1002]
MPAAPRPEPMPPSAPRPSRRWGRRALLRRLSLGASLALAAALGLAACRPAQPPEPEIQFWTLDLAPRFNDYIRGVIAAWEQRNPGMRVRWTDLPWSSVERKLLAAVFARTAPDVVNLNPLFAANLASKGGLLPLDPLLPPDAAQTYLPKVWKAGQLPGPDGPPSQFAVPWYLTARITLANRDLLAKAGYSRPPLRWQEVPAYAEAVKRRTGRYALFVTVVPDDSAELLESLVQMDVRLLDGRQRAAFNSPEGRRAFAFWTDLYRRGLLPREVVSQGYRRAIELYQSGELAQVASGAEFLRSIQTNAPGIAAVTAPFPPLTGAGGEANVAVMNLAVPRQSRLPKEALSFALFLTDATNQLAFAEQARVLPSATGALDQLEAALAQERPQGRPDQLVRQARMLSAETLGQARVLVPASPGVKRLQAILYTQLQRAMLGQMGSDQALAAAEQEWNRYAEARWP